MLSLQSSTKEFAKLKFRDSYVHSFTSLIDYIVCIVSFFWVCLWRLQLAVQIKQIYLSQFHGSVVLYADLEVDHAVNVWMEVALFLLLGYLGRMLGN